MTIREVVNEMCGKTVRVQTIRDGYTEFIAKDEIYNDLLLGRVKNYPVDHIKTEIKDGKEIIHIYGINYLDYRF